MTFERPTGKPQFTAPWFKWFLPNLTLPEGYPMQWAGHLLLMTDEFFKPELMSLLCLIPKGNWKTTWEGGLADWHLLTVPAPRAYAGAADKGQAQELYDFAAHFADSDPEIAAKLITRPSTKEIRCASAPGRAAFKVLASDDSKGGGKKQGLNTTLSLGDEIHAWENRHLWVDLRSGGFKRREAARLAGDPLWHSIGKLAAITTEGYDSESLLAEELDKFLGNPEKELAPLGTVEEGLRVLPDGSTERYPDGRLTIARYGNGRNVLLRWACREDDDTDNSAVVKFANPAPTATVESLDDARTALTPWEFLRYRCNVRTLGFSSWLPQGAWDTLYSHAVPRVEHRTWEEATLTGEAGEDGNVVPTEEFLEYVRSLYPEGASIVAAVDMARYRDTAAVVVLGRDEADMKVPRAFVWRSGGHDNPIRYDWPKTALRLLDAAYDLTAVAYDPKYFDQSGEELHDEGIAMEEFPQSNERIGPADTELRREILDAEQQFAHDGDPILSRHIAAGKAQDIGPKVFKVVQQDGAKPPPIDACKALSMANAIEKLTVGSMYDDPEATI